MAAGWLADLGATGLLLADGLTALPSGFANFFIGLTGVALTNFFAGEAGFFSTTFLRAGLTGCFTTDLTTDLTTGLATALEVAFNPGLTGDFGAEFPDAAALTGLVAGAAAGLAAFFAERSVGFGIGSSSNSDLAPPCDQPYGVSNAEAAARSVSPPLMQAVSRGHAEFSGISQAVRLQIFDRKCR